MAFKYVWVFPVLLFIEVPLTFVITYVIAATEGHVEWVFPYISDTGAIPPESCIFGQLLNIGALLGCITVYLRHRQIMEFYRDARQHNKCLITTSLVFLWIGYLSCLGMSLVANFQETSVIIVHLIGAFMAFGLGLVYGYGQTVLTYMVDKVFVGIWMAHIRLILCLLATACFVLLQANGFVSHSGGNGPTPAPNATEYPIIDHARNLNGTAYDWYLVSAFSEWGFSFCCMVFFGTFAVEFRKSVLLPPRMLLDIDLKHFPGCPITDSEEPSSEVDESENNKNQTATNVDKYHSSRMNVYPEVRVTPTTGNGQSRDKSAGYRSNDETKDWTYKNYGTNDPSNKRDDAPPILFKPVPAKRANID